MPGDAPITTMTDHDSSGNSIWLGILVLLLLVLGASVFLNWRQRSQVVAMEAEIDELYRQNDGLRMQVEEERLWRAMETVREEGRRRRAERGGDLILDP